MYLRFLIYMPFVLYLDHQIHLIFKIRGYKYLAEHYKDSNFAPYRIVLILNLII